MNFQKNIKNNFFHKAIFIALLFVIFNNNVFAFDSTPREDYFRSEIKENKFEDNTWKKAIEGIDYSKQSKTKKKKREEKDNEEDSEIVDEELDRSYDDGIYYETQPMNSFWSGFFKFLLIAIAVVVLAFVIANVIGADGITGKSSNKKIPTDIGEITIDNVEENIHESDLDRFLREALQQENYPLAVRLYYLAIIKELSLNKWIKWKKDKTNRSYLRELKNTSVQDSFKKATSIFERVWYGNKELKGMDFRVSIQPQFQQLLEKTKQLGRKA